MFACGIRHWETAVGRHFQMVFLASFLRSKNQRPLNSRSSHSSLFHATSTEDPMECVQNLRVNDAQQSNSALWLVLSGSMLNRSAFVKNGPRVVDGCFYCRVIQMALDHPQSEHGAVTGKKWPGIEDMNISILFILYKLQQKLFLWLMPCDLWFIKDTSFHQTSQGP